MNETLDVKSPITGGRTRLIKTTPSENIIKMYGDFDISKYFHDTQEVKTFECEDTKYIFFYPFDITGDDRYYAHLSKNNWYYMPWKWEHKVALKEIRSGDKVLEIGCANGDFLKHAADIGAQCMGIEMNEDAIKICKEKKLNVTNKPLNKLENTEGKFDVVCAFQVLEHIPDIKEFISQAVKMLKTSGKLIFAVPNNGSFIGKDNKNHLNMPPHHMGLWNKESLINISKYFNLKNIKTIKEPLQKYHMSYYFNTKMNDAAIAKKMNPVTKKIFGFIFKVVIYLFRKGINGHTILAVYVKQ